MESQSKTLATNTENLTGVFTTPGDENVFKLKLDAEIPNFNLFPEDALVENTSEHFAANENQALNLYDNTRPKRGRKVADIHKSPYFDRLTAIYGKTFRKEESDLWEWLHANDQYPK